MDQYVQQPGGASEPNLFQPDEGVSDLQAGSRSERTSSYTPQTDVSMQGQDFSLPSNSYSWRASEFIEHKKSALWFLCLFLAVIAIGAITWFAAHDVFLSVMVVLGAGVFGIYAAHRPKQTTYKLDGASLGIGGRTYSLSQFRSFSIIPEGSVLRIELAPLKRFAVSTTMYCQPGDSDRVIAMLTAYLPMSPSRSNWVDRFMRSIRF